MAISRCYRLPYEKWPVEDRRRWEQLTSEDFDLFGPERPLARMKPKERKALRSCYSAFLGFVATQHPERLKLAPEVRLDRPLAKEWLDLLLPLYRGSTVGDMVDDVRYVLSALADESDWSWLRTVADFGRKHAVLKPKQYPHVTSGDLLDLGMTLMDEAEKEADAIGRVHLFLATKYRDGLMIALLACVPLRMRSLSSLRIGKHLAKIGEKWILDVPAEDTKTRVALEYDVPRFLFERIDVYIARFRPRFQGAADHDYLWATKFGGHLHSGPILEAIKRRTRQAFGFSVSPHRFRHAAATFLSERDPANVLAAKDLLGHRSFTMTEKHYIMSQSRIAGRKFAAILAKRREARRPHLRRRVPSRRIRRAVVAPLSRRHRAIAAAGTLQAKQALA